MRATAFLPFETGKIPAERTKIILTKRDTLLVNFFFSKREICFNELPGEVLPSRTLSTLQAGPPPAPRFFARFIFMEFPRNARKILLAEKIYLLGQFFLFIIRAVFEEFLEKISFLAALPFFRPWIRAVWANLQGGAEKVMEEKGGQDERKGQFLFSFRD